MPVPLFTTDSDNGIGFGAALAYYRGDGCTMPFRLGLVAQVLQTTAGVMDDYVNFDWVHPLDAPVRVVVETRYRREPNASWFGAGNTSSRSMGLPAQYNQYSQQVPAIRVVIMQPIWEHFSVFESYLFEYGIEKIYPGSLLAREPATGVEGGSNAPLGIGVDFDSRDSETWPTRGHYAEASFRGAGSLTGSRYAWQGATVAWRAFAPLPWDLVAGARLLVDAMHGDVPFYDLDATGSLHELDGLGGANTLRGFVKDRFVGKGKALANIEVRRLFARFSPFGVEVDLGAVTFVDVGRVYGASFEDGPPLLVHVDAGGGLRALLNRELVVRVDVGASVEGPRLYALFQNTF